MVRSSHPVAGSSGPWIRNRTFPKAFGRPPSGGLNRSSLQSGRADRRNRGARHRWRNERFAYAEPVRVLPRRRLHDRRQGLTSGDRNVANSIVRRATSSWAKQSSAAAPADTCWSGQGLVRRACAGLLGCMSVCLELAVPLRGVTAHDGRARPGRGRVSQRLAHSGTERE